MSGLSGDDVKGNASGDVGLVQLSTGGSAVPGHKSGIGAGARTGKKNGLDAGTGKLAFVQLA